MRYSVVSIRFERLDGQVNCSERQSYDGVTTYLLYSNFINRACFAPCLSDSDTKCHQVINETKQTEEPFTRPLMKDCDVIIALIYISACKMCTENTCGWFETE